MNPIDFYWRCPTCATTYLKIRRPCWRIHPSEKLITFTPDYTRAEPINPRFTPESLRSHP